MLNNTSAFDDALKVPLFDSNHSKNTSSSSSVRWNESSTTNASGLNNNQCSSLISKLSRENDKANTLARCLSLSISTSSKTVTPPSDKQKKASTTIFNNSSRDDLHKCLNNASKLTKEIHVLFQLDSEYLVGSKKQQEQEMLNNKGSGDNTTTNESLNSSTLIDTASAFFKPITRQERQLHNRLRRDFQREVQRLEKTTKEVQNMERAAAKLLAVQNQGDNDHLGISAEGEGVVGMMATQAHEDAVLAERKNEIIMITNSMQKVGEIYNDLANLVDEQQYEIDDIESNILNSHNRTEAGIDQLQKATNFQKSSSKCIVWLLLLILVAAIVCIGILYGGQITD